MSETFSYQNLFAGNVFPNVTEKATIALGAGSLAAGTVLGKINSAYSAYAAGTPSSAGAGKGAMTMATPATGTGVKVGTYTVTCVTVATDLGNFLVQDPAGKVIGVAKVGVAFDGEIKFTIADGATDFALNDKITVAVTGTAATTVGKCVVVDSTLTNGAQNAYAVLAEAVDATSADKEVGVYLTGEFNENSLVFGGTDTADTHRLECRKIGLFFKKAIAK
jgi:hypothetical protein